MNQLAFPGLGTLLSGRRVIGYSQASIMVGGFLLVMAFFCWTLICMFRSINGTIDPNNIITEYLRYGWVAVAGFSLCLISWVWALASSIEILRSSVDPKTDTPVHGEHS